VKVSFATAGAPARASTAAHAAASKDLLMVCLRG
jgi:hypothetical protein